MEKQQWHPNFITSLILLIISLLVVPFLSAIVLIVYSLICITTLKFKKLSVYYYNCAASADQTGNAFVAPGLNVFLKKQKGYSFGNRDETVSGAMGKNLRINKLTKFGIFISKILEWLDPNHLEKSIEDDE